MRPHISKAVSLLRDAGFVPDLQRQHEFRRGNVRVVLRVDETQHTYWAEARDMNGTDYVVVGMNDSVEDVIRWITEREEALP